MRGSTVVLISAREALLTATTGLPGQFASLTALTGLAEAYGCGQGLSLARVSVSVTLPFASQVSVLAVQR
jgi:hypothetical protein